jgi:hypothetical protein
VSVFIHIGNSNAVEGYKDERSDEPDLTRYRPAPGERITEFVFPDDIELEEAFLNVIGAFLGTADLNNAGRHVVPGGSGDWVDGDSPELVALVAARLKCPVGRPKLYGQETQAPRGLSQGPGGLAGLLAVEFGLLVVAGIWAASKLQLRTNVGRDFMASVTSNTASNGTGAYAPASYIGVSADATVPAATDTALAGEIVAATLTRAQATYAHTTGTGSYTLTKTFTSDQSITLQKMGVFNDPTTGTLVFAAMLNAVSTMVAGDQTQITETVNL